MLQEFAIGNRGQRSASYYSNRRQQAVDRLDEIINQNWLPRRNQYILDTAEDSDIESELREPVQVSESEAEEEQQVEPPQDPCGASSSSHTVPSISERIKTAKVSTSNPILSKSTKARPKPSVRQSSSASAPSAKPKAIAEQVAVERPSAVEVLESEAEVLEERIDHDLLRRHGVVIAGDLGDRPLTGLIVSLDWHQVLDTIRTNSQTLRTDNWNWYYLLDPIKERLRAIRNIADQRGQPLKIIVLSYTHSPTFRDKVLQLLPWESNYIDLAVTTQERTGIGGKVWTLKHLCSSSSRIWHADDNIEICKEIVGDSEQRIRVAGIRVPKHWKTQRQLNIHWRQNILYALQIFLKG